MVGDKDNGKIMYLKAWDTICTPKCSSGLGIRRLRDMNTVYVTNLGWRLCTDMDKIWVKLVRLKYLRGRRVLNFQNTQRVASWVWNGIKLCYGSLRKGLCIRVG